MHITRKNDLASFTKYKNAFILYGCKSARMDTVNITGQARKGAIYNSRRNSSKITRRIKKLDR